MNWTAIFGRLPDIRAEVLRRATADTELWSEWEMVGTAPDGTQAGHARAGHHDDPRRTHRLDTFLSQPCRGQSVS